jgi:P27 family predicted phage terminase small subunit
MIAKVEWRRLEPELTRLGMLTVLDLSKFAAYCRWYSRWRRCEQRLDKLFTTKAGEVITTKSGYEQQHPQVAMARAALEVMNRLGTQFGLSPSDRTGFGLPLDPTAPAHDKPETPSRPPRDEFDEFLRENRKKHAPPA